MEGELDDLLEMESSRQEWEKGSGGVICAGDGKVSLRVWKDVKRKTRGKFIRSSPTLIESFEENKTRVQILLQGNVRSLMMG